MRPSGDAIGVAVLMSPATRSWGVRLPLALFALLLLCAGVVRAAVTTAASATDSPALPIERTTFDHLTTGFELVGQHRDLPCETCHFNAVFKGTPRDCATCHGMGTQVHPTAK